MIKLFTLKKAQLWLGFFVSFLLISCGGKTDSIIINGFTMGTTYSVKIIDDTHLNIDSKIIKSKIDSALVDVNQQMSTYIEDSDISIFNQQKNTNWQNISNEFYFVIDKSINISKMTNGAFDITVGPLMDLWGFGIINQNNWNPPIVSQLLDIKEFVGINKIELSGNRIRKLDSRTTIDLNAIAKGFGVDVVFELLGENGYENILVEIGGEIRCSGLNQNEEYWKVGIDKPIYDILPGADLQEIISINNSALATSGDYRNYFYHEGNIYSHTVNPKTGLLVENGISSASVIAPTCLLADALATALMVMGIDGLKLIEDMDGVEALLVERISENEFKTTRSSGWITN